MRAGGSLRGLAPGRSLASIPIRYPAGRGCAAGVRRFQPGAEAPGPVPFGSGIGASPSAFAFGLDRSELRPPTFGIGSKQAPTFSLSASTEANFDLPPRASTWATPRLDPLGFPVGASSSVRPGSIRSKRAPILRRRLQRASPLSPAGPGAGRTPFRFRSGHSPKQAPAGALPLSLRRGDSRFRSNGRGTFHRGFRCRRAAFRNPASHPLSLMLVRLHPPSCLRRSAHSF